MVGNATPVIVMEEDGSVGKDQDSEEVENVECAPQPGVLSTNVDGSADDRDAQAGERCPLDMDSVVDTSGVEVEESVSSGSELAGIEQAVLSGKSVQNSEGLSIPSVTLRRRQPCSKLKAAREAKKLEATLSGSIQACDLCPFKSCYSGVMSRHIRAHSHYKSCACDFCDFKCRGIELMDRHVIENHLNEIDNQPLKNGKNPIENLASIPVVPVGYNLDPMGKRYKNKLKKSVDATSDHVSLPKPPSRPSRRKTNKIANKGLNLAHLSSVLAKKLNAPSTGNLGDSGNSLKEPKIHSLSAMLPQDFSKGLEPCELPMSESSSQVIGNASDITTNEISFGEVPKQSRLSPAPTNFTVDQSVTSQTDDEESSRNKVPSPSLSTTQLTPPKKRKISDTDQPFRLSNLPMKAPWNSSSKLSEDVLAGELREYLLLKERGVGATIIGTSTHCAQSTSSATKPTTSQKFLTCTKCDFKTSGPLQLSKHTKIHIEPYACDFCDYKGRGYQSLKKHLRMHTPSVVIR